MWQCPTKQNQISEHGVSPLAFVQVRQLGAWKVHPYNSNAKCVFLSKFYPFGTILKHIVKFVVMMFVLV